jgi:hypothetical protein
MDKERLEELKKLCDHVTSASLYASDKYMETAGALPELIAEVEFLTKVAEQAVDVGDLSLWNSYILNADRDAVGGRSAGSCPELAQYLKRGKE